jgi:hypothetical protein
MTCPGCSASMTTLTLEKRLGTTVDVDYCGGCRVIWFDRYEDLQLSPASTLKLFGIISDRSTSAGAPIPGATRCPRCAAKLVQTHDSQRNTPFRYWRCTNEHGRLMTFVDFLRAKDFIRPLSPQQLSELRANVQTINCSQCGGTIDLARDSVCRHCGSAVSMLDLKQMAKTIGVLQAAAAPKDPADLATIVLAMKAREERARDVGPVDLVETGLDLFGDWLRRAF